MKILQINGIANTTYSPNRKIEYICIHYTAGTNSNQGVARNVANLFKNANVGGSADFIVDDVEFVQYNGDIKNRYCWSVGGDKYKTMSTKLGGSHYYKCFNNNSISIEICSSKVNKNTLNVTDNDWYLTEDAVNNAVELTKYLMKTYNIPVERVIMHHQVTGKVCPQPWTLNQDRLQGWYNFLNKVQDKPSKVYTNVKISINGKTQEYNSINIEGYNYVESRKFLETLGYNVGWNNDKKRITVDNTLTLDIPTILENNKSYIKVRDCIEFLNKYDTWKYTQDKVISWDNNTNTIIIS